MAESTAATRRMVMPGGNRWPATLLLVVMITVLVFGFWDAVLHMVSRWKLEEYNHAYLLPFVAAFLMATRADDLKKVPWSGSLAGLWLVVLGFLLNLFGTMSSIFMISQYGFVVAIWGCFVLAWGWPAVKLVWPALVYLVFMVPLPNFLEVKLTAGLQLVSTQIGVAVVRLAKVPVYVEGNVIDLGIYQLAVAEACSGLRYLFPLMSFGFLCAVLFQAPRWQRAVVFLSSIPLTVLMNSIRIGVISILVSYYGVEQAEGFLHDFEGWVIFMTCVVILFIEMFIMARLSGRGLLASLRMDTPPLGETWRIFTSQGISRATVVGAVAVLAVTLAMVPIKQREDFIPMRSSFATFPLVLGGWAGQEGDVDQITLDALKADDTFLALYGNTEEAAPVNLWLAYYSSQRSGRSIHSPSSCLPGGGWKMTDFRRIEIDGVRADGSALPVNRSIIAMGDAQQLVYYWFSQRGRMMTNEYFVKWFIFWDGLTMQRTDGALVRVVTPVDKGPNGMEEAEARLQNFVRLLDPKLSYYLPDRDAAPQVDSPLLGAR